MSDDLVIRNTTRAELDQLVGWRAMEALGYLTLERRPNNRKNVYVFLTSLGKRLRKTLVPLAEEVNAVAVKRSNISLRRM